MNTRKYNDAIVVALLSGQSMGRRDQFEAAQILYNVYIPIVEAYLRKQFRGCCIPSLFDSIIVETMERVARSINKFDPGRARLTTYLIGFARLVALERLRKELDMVFLDDLEEEPAAEPSEASSNARTVLRELLRGPYAPCLESLDEKYRALIEMAIDGMPPESYQAQFEVTRSTYRKRKERAIKELRERIELMGPGAILD